MRVLLLPDLALVERPAPRPGEGELLVSVRAVGLNRADLLQRLGRYPAPPGWPTDVPGLEYAGVVTAIGEGVTRFAIGDRVMGLVGGGAMVEQLVIHEAEAIRVPDRLGDIEAAAVPEAFLTAWDALVIRGRAVAGDRVLFHAIGSGVGTAALQFAPLLGVTMIGTSRTAGKLERCRALGLHHGVLTTDDDWPTAVDAPVQLIIDTLGAKALTANLGLLAPLGRLVVLGTMTGSETTIDLGVVLRKRLSIIGTAMRNRGAAERRALMARFDAEVLPHFASGALTPLVEAVVPMTEAVRGYDLLAGNTTFGKVVLAW
ncbi:MAG: NAD(P)H-quinone oxidoreductase [Gemmatimonadales bacterium]|jgi:NADPH:quinone reductase-like Zn-dependent oxidoreductase|nr:NAD(P)H-quinone oxidoreductase [Gemmatimonadota bacterium]MBP9897302.1 NAD(P)H-quinone oxidoreductase [Gemmatimonadales bacterium]